MPALLARFAILLSSLALTGCFTTLAPQGEPPLTVRPGKAPLATFIMHEYDPGVGMYARDLLKDCLQTRNVFEFVPQRKVDETIAAGGYDIDRVYGLSGDEYRKIAAATGADYVIFGNLRVVKALKLHGWRHDIYTLFYLANGRSGKTVDSWRSDSIVTFVDPAAELDPKRMTEPVVNHTCAKMMEARLQAE